MRGIINVASAAADIAPCRAEGLRKLEYRGYHSACIAVLNGVGVQRVRTAGRRAKPAASTKAVTAHASSARTRSATHGGLSVRIADASGAPVERPVVVSQLFADAADLLAGVRSVLILACGTSYHSGVTARYGLESLAGIPCTVEIASEYRYRSSVADPDQLVVTISQSGETADTLAALRHARDLGHARTLAICNVPESAIVRECALRFITRAGPEIGVASTKAFTTQLAALFLLTLVVRKLRGRIDEQAEHDHLARLRHLPVAVARVRELKPSDLAKSVTVE